MTESEAISHMAVGLYGPIDVSRSQLMVDLVMLDGHLALGCTLHHGLCPKSGEAARESLSLSSGLVEGRNWPFWFSW
jgi:hypothetical protein